MGNVLNGPTESDSSVVEQKDREFLELPCSSVFNDEYVNSIFKSLPNLDGAVDDDNKSKAGDKPEIDAKLQCIIGILAANVSKNDSVDLENFQKLSIEKEYSGSAFAETIKQRSRLLLRIHQAFLRQASAATASSGSGSDLTNTGIFKGAKCAKQLGQDEDPNAVLASMNAAMCLSIAKTVGRNYPELAINLSNSLVDILKGLGPSSLVKEGRSVSPLLRNTMQSVFQYACDLEATSIGELRSVALGLMLVVASSVGSVEYIMATVNALIRGEEKLSSSILSILEDLNAIKTDFNLITPSAKTVEAKWKASGDTLKAALSMRSSTVASDGFVLYVWDDAAAAVRKIGTGVNGTIEGEEIMSNANVSAQIQAIIGVPEATGATAAESVETTEATNQQQAQPELPVPCLTNNHGSSITIDDDCFGCYVAQSNPQSVFLNVSYADNAGDVGNYFEVEVISSGSTSQDAVGLGLCDTGVFNVETEFPGWHAGSYGYHGDNGQLYGVGSSGSVYSTFSSGSVVGCGYIAATRSIFFTLNGNILAPSAFTDVTVSPLTPVVTFQGTNNRIRINPGSKPFMYAGPEVVYGKFAANAKSSASKRPRKAQASLAFANRKLYLRSLDLLGPTRVAILSIKSLKVEDVATISDPQALVDTETVDKTVAEFTFAYEHTEVVDIRAAAGYTVHVVSATFQEVDCTEVVKNLVTPDGTILHFGDLVTVLGDPSPGMPKRLSIQAEAIPTHLIDGDTDPRDAKTGDSFLECCTSDGRHIGMLNTSTRCNPASKKALYSCVRDVEILSAYYFDTNFCGPNVAQLVKDKFEDYLSNRHTSSYSPVRAANDWLSDPQYGTQKTLWINYRIDSSPVHQVLTTNEGAVIEWETICNQACCCFSGYSTELQYVVVDPLNNMTVARRVALSSPSSMYPGTETLLEETALMTNGQKLVMHQTQFGGRGELKRKMRVFKFDISKPEADLLEDALVEYEKSEFFPSTFTYDSISNSIWSWDCVTRVFARWRNVGLRPRTGEANAEPSLISASPALRLKCLWKTSNAESLSRSSSIEQAATLCTLLDKLSEAYGPGLVGNGSAEVDPISEIELVSKCYNNNVSGFSSIKVRGKSYGLGSNPDSGSGRSYNIVVLSSTLTVESAVNFDTSGNSGEVEKLADFVAGIAEGKVVLVATNYSAVTNFNKRGFDALRSLGADAVGLERSLAAGVQYEPFAFIGKKGARPGTAIQKTGSQSKTVKIRQKIPSQPIPLKVEPTGSNMTALTHSVLKYHSLWSQAAATSSPQAPYYVSLLISTFHILSVNTYQMLQGMSEDEAMVAFNADDRSKLKDLLLHIIDADCNDKASESISKAALQLFIESINLLYPTSALRQGLLQNYLQQYNNNQLSSQEMKVLELLLKRVTNPKELATIVSSDDTSSITSLLTTLMGILRTELPKRLNAVVANRKDKSATLAADPGSLGEASVGLISSLSKMLLSRAAQEIVLAAETQSIEGEIRGKRGGFTLITMVATMVTTCCEILTEVVTANNAIIAVGSTGNAAFLDTDVDDLLRSSLVGTLVPFFLSSTSLVLSSHGMKLLQWVDQSLFSNLYSGLANFSTQLQQLVQTLEPEVLYSSSVSRINKLEKVFESEHPYANSLDTMTEVSIPGASKLTFIFDPASRTENGCDYLRFLDDAGNVLHPSFSYFTGRDGSQNWPGCEGRPPLELEVDTCKMHFHSDGSVNDWGYKFTVSAEIAVSSSKNAHWLIGLSRQLVSCKSSLATTYISSIPWNEPLEDPLSSWMCDNLIQPELFHGKMGKSDEDQLLLDLTERPEGSLADSLVKIMKKKVREDQGSDDLINKAVYATCAALIKHNNLTHEAFALAKFTRPEVSSQLIKAWTSAQKMRAYFDLADLRFAQGSNDNATGGGANGPSAPATLSRADSSTVPSLYSGADSEVLEAATQAVVERAQFLIRSTIEEEVDAEIAPSSPRPKLSSGMSRTPSYMAKQRWGLLAKSEGLRKQSSGDQRRGSWGTLVNELVVSEKVKNILAYRRKAAGKKHSKQSMTEKVLSFIQSRVSISQLEQLNDLRTKRAGFRASGISLLASSLDPNDLPFSLSQILYAFAHSMRTASQNETSSTFSTSRVHYGVVVEGSSQKAQDSLATSFGAFVERTLAVLEKGKSILENENCSEAERNSWKSTVIACFKALALDYQEQDHPFLDRTGLLGYLIHFSDSKDDEIREVSQTLFEVLVTRCVASGVKHAGSHDLAEGSEPTSFSLKLVDTIADRVRLLAENTMDYENDCLGSASGSTSIVKGLKHLRSSDISPGYSYPHIALGLNHSVSVWVRRPRSAKIDGATLAAGSVVMRGCDWKQDCDDDGGLGSLGTVISVKNGIVKVAWANGKSGEYKFGEQEDGSIANQIALGDPLMSGNIFTKGFPALFDDADLRKRIPQWAIFGLEMFADGSLGYFMSDGSKAGYTTNRTKSTCAPDAWHLVTVVQRKEKNVFYLNGNFESEITLEELMFKAGGGGGKQVVESVHPYLDNTDSYETFNFPGATKLTITFDDQTRTEASYDYIRFYKGDEHTEVWGENYSGGRGGSTRNFPGLDGKPPLVIPAGSVCVYFRSDGSNNDWGYKFTIEAEGCDPELTFSETNLNSSPFSIGNGPIYSSSHPSVNADIVDLRVYPAALSATEVNNLFSSLIAPAFPLSLYDDDSALSILSQMLKGINSVSRQATISNSLERTLTSPRVFKSLLSIVVNGSPIVQSTAFRVMAVMVPRMEIEVVNNVCAMVVNSEKYPSFIHYLFALVGSSLCVSYNAMKDNTLKPNHEFAYGMAVDGVSLLRSLALAGSVPEGQVAVTNAAWQGVVRTVMLETISSSVASLRNLTALKEELTSGMSPQEAQPMIALLGFIGGVLSGIFPGAQCVYLDDNGLSEVCTVIHPTSKPVYDEKKDKALAKTWENVDQYGEAVVIVLNSQPSTPLTVPRESLSVTVPSAAGDLSALFSEFFESHNDCKLALIELYQALAELDTTDSRPVLLPIKEKKDIELVFESTHPYADGLDVYTDISCPGANSMTITFDSRSMTEQGCDYIRFYKDSRHEGYWGEQSYSGRNGSENFPGVNNIAPLEIPSGSAVLYFHSDGSGNDWGYYFTVRATIVTTIAPPELPVLPQLFMMRHLKMMGMRSLSLALGNSSWLSRGVLDILPAVVRSALYPLPKSKSSGGNAKPLIIESKHPYDNSMDEYTPVRIKGAKKLSVSFDPMSATENGCDYVRFYTDASHGPMVPGGENLTGGKDGGTSNWPGMQDRPPLIVEGDSFEIYFHSDGSVNAWGYKIFITPIGGGSSDESEDVFPTLCPSPDNSSLRYFYLWELGRDRPGKLFADSPSVADLTRFEMKPASKFCQKYITFEEESVLGGGDEESKSSDPVARTNSPSTSEIDKTFRVNVRAAWPKGYAVNDGFSGDVSVFADASIESAVVFTFSDKTKMFLASEASGDWLRVKVLELDGAACMREIPSENPPEDVEGEDPPPSTTTSVECEGWVRLRDGDETFLQSNNSVPGCVPELVIVPSFANSITSSSSGSGSGAGGCAANNAGSPTIHPMYEIDDKCTKIADSANAKGLNTLEFLRESQKHVVRGLLDTSNECGIGYSHAALSKLFSTWPMDVPLSTDLFGGFNSLVTYMLITYDCQEKLYVDALASLKSLLLNALRASDSSAKELCKNFIAFAKAQLSSSNIISRKAPVNRGLKLVIETRHPYEDNTHRDYPIKLAGSKYLLLVFDEKSATETNCDYVTVTDGNGTERGGKIHGRVDAAEKNWSGVGSTPPLRIDGDCCNVNFHSDGGVVDWGFKLTVYGIVEEASPEETEAYDKYVALQSNTKLHPDFACWLLQVLSREQSSTLDKLLYTADTLKSVGDYFARVDDEKRSVPLQLLSNILQSIQKFASISPEIIKQVHLLRSSVMDVASALYKTETNNGADTQKVSKLLQLCVQFIIVIDTMLTSSGSNAGRAPTTAIGSALPPNVVSLDGADNTNLHAVDNKGFFRWLPEGLADNLETANARRVIRRKPVTGPDNQADTYTTALGKYGFESGVHSWNIRVSEYRNGEPVIGVAMLPISPSLQVGTCSQQNDVGWGNQLLYVRGFDPVPFGPQIRPGDIVSVTIDVGKGTVLFYRNSALVGLAVGPANSGAAVETVIGMGPFYPAVSLRNVCDSVEFVEFPIIDGSDSGQASNLVESALPVPEWMKSLKEVVSTLRSFLTHEVPMHILNSRFLPTCLRFATQTIAFDELSWPNNAIDIGYPDAHALCIYFCNTKLEDSNLLRILDGSGNVIFEKQGLAVEEAPADLVASSLNLFGGHTGAAESKKSDIAVGSVVVRGADWCWEDQDGGVGCTGIVTAIQDWKGSSNSGVQVKWNNSNHIGLYRWDFNGCFDVKVFNMTSMPTLTQDVSTSGIIIPGSTATIEIVSTGDSESFKQLNFHIVPNISLASALTNPDFEPLLTFLRAQYIGNGSLQGDFALVRHVDARAKALELATAGLLVSKWETFKPSTEDLTRSAALKCLMESPVPVYPDGFEEIALPVVKSAGSEVALSRPVKYYVARVATNGCLTYDECERLAARIGGRLPSYEEIERAHHIVTAASSDCVYWPSIEAPGQWVALSPDGVEESNAAWLQSNEYNASRSVIGVSVPACDGVPTCENCSEDCVLSDFNGGVYGQGGFACNTCRQHGSDMRWLCLPCTSDYCLNCRPPQLNGTVQDDIHCGCDPASAVSAPFTSCMLTQTRPDADTDFDSLEDAITCNQFLTPPCKGIVFDYTTGKYYLRDGDTLVPSHTGATTFMWRYIDPENIGNVVTPTGSEPQPAPSGSTTFQNVSTICLDFSGVESTEALAEFLMDMQCDWVNIDEGLSSQVVVSSPSEVRWNFSEDKSVISASTEAPEYECSIIGTQLTRSFDDQEPSRLRILYSVCGNDLHGQIVSPFGSDLIISDNLRSLPGDEPKYALNDPTRQIIGLLEYSISADVLQMLLQQQVADVANTYSAGFRYGGDGFTAATIHVIIADKEEGNKTTNGTEEGDTARGRKTPAVEPTVQARFNIIRAFNAALNKALPLIDLTAVDQPGSVASLLSVCRGLVFEATKTPIWETALNATTGTGGQFELRLSRSRARKFINSGQVDHDGRFMVFSQAFRQMHPMAPSTLRRSDKLYTAQFMGERAHDAGGPYRESFGMYAQELQSKSLPLMLPTPNGRHTVGYNRDKWVLNPASTSPAHLEMFAFLGKLMGIAIRSKEYLALSIPSIIWKLLVNDVVTVDDLEGIDFSLVKSMNSIRNIDESGIDSESFSATFFETFTTTTIDDRIVELVPGGMTRDVTFENRAEYCDLVLKYRMHEFDVQAAAVRKGLATMVPAALLSLFSWNSLETMVCGNAEIDVKLLESVTEYSGCSANDAHVRLFWQALGEFNNDERSAMIRFCWGRSRLPLNAASFTQRFKLQSFGHNPPDVYLPVAHTCFFSLELPAYSTLTIMKEKLRYAIFNCEAIDGDDTSTGMAVAAMGWEE